MAIKLLPWDDGHAHTWRYFGGMASCIHCAGFVLPNGAVKKPSASSRAHRLRGLDAAKREDAKRSAHHFTDPTSNGDL